VVFSGQLIAQTIMACDREAAGAKEVRSVHTVFARAGTYTKPLELVVEAIHTGRTWASDTVTSVQEGRLLARSLVLLNTVDPDLVRHGPTIPAAPPPGDLPAGPGQVFPGGDWRPVPGGGERDGVPVGMAWHRYGGPLSSPAENKAVLAWATCGDVIGVALRPHAERVRLSDAHRTLSTGVIAHTLHFLEPFEVSAWLLVVIEGTSAAAGRIYGAGSVFSEDGRLVAVFHQDSMAKSLDAPADPRRSL
jgi:acyl-CoA thioesterase-2